MYPEIGPPGRWFSSTKCSGFQRSMLVFRSVTVCCDPFCKAWAKTNESFQAEQYTSAQEPSRETDLTTSGWSKNMSIVHVFFFLIRRGASMHCAQVKVKFFFSECDTTKTLTLASIRISLSDDLRRYSPKVEAHPTESRTHATEFRLVQCDPQVDQLPHSTRGGCSSLRYIPRLTIFTCFNPWFGNSLFLFTAESSHPA